MKTLVQSAVTTAFLVVCCVASWREHAAWSFAAWSVVGVAIALLIAYPIHGQPQDFRVARACLFSVQLVLAGLFLGFKSNSGEVGAAAIFALSLWGALTWWCYPLYHSTQSGDERAAEQAGSRLAATHQHASEGVVERTSPVKRTEEGVLKTVPQGEDMEEECAEYSDSIRPQQEHQRWRDEQGAERLVWRETVQFQSGEQTKYLHIPFSPMLTNAKVLVMSEGIDDLRSRTTLLGPFGARIELKAPRLVDESTEVHVEVEFISEPD